jgi:phosphoserine phosphatase
MLVDVRTLLLSTTIDQRTTDDQNTPPLPTSDFRLPKMAGILLRPQNNRNPFLAERVVLDKKESINTLRTFGFFPLRFMPLTATNWNHFLLTIMLTLQFSKALVSRGIVRAVQRPQHCLPQSLFLVAQRSASSSAAYATKDSMSPDDLYKSLRGSIQSSTGNDIPTAIHSLYTADAVCFDVDSTVIAEEAIDVLAEYLGKGEEVAALTKKAMEGATKFQDALQMRLDLMQPARDQILACLRDQPLVLTPGVEQLMMSLKHRNVDIWLVSGGFRIMIEPVAHQLGIPISNIVANTILFDAETGKYTGFDTNEPTSRDMGKPKALQQIQADHKYETMVMVGDGATDAQAKPPAKSFIGFGGVVVRDAVQKKADWFVTDFADMIRVVESRP